jgi:tRNA-dependent cyclodipeptide synthase
MRFFVKPLTENCDRVFREADHLVVGVSPGNRYFSVSLLSSLFGWAVEHFRRVDVILPDTDLVHNYLALGYPEDQAVKKTCAEIRTVRSRVKRAWDDSGAPTTRRHTHLLSELTNNRVYQDLRGLVEARLRTDGRFREASLRTVLGFLRKHLSGAKPTPGQVEHAERYLIAELPFLLGSARIFWMPSSLNFYHRKIPLAELLYMPGSPLRAPRQQGYAVIHPLGTSDGTDV